MIPPFRVRRRVHIRFLRPNATGGTAGPNSHENHIGPVRGMQALSPHVFFGHDAEAAFLVPFHLACSHLAECDRVEFINADLSVDDVASPQYPRFGNGVQVMFRVFPGQSSPELFNTVAVPSAFNRFGHLLDDR